MPEMMPRRPEYTMVKNRETATREHISKVEGTHILGSGAECFVFEHPDEPGKAVGVTRHAVSPYRAKEIFYSQRIYQTLFPHNFPKIYASFAEDPNEQIGAISGTIRERVIGLKAGESGYTPNAKNAQTSNVFLMMFSRLIGTQTAPDYSFSAAKKAAEKLNVPFYFDEDKGNYMLSAEKEELFVDTIPHFSPLSWNEAALLKQMNRQGYTKEDQDKVMKSLQRLKALNDQEAIRLTS